ncbi:MAG: choice-of-anchor Q domain-containing protein [Pseudomonadota bacterium]
MTIEDSAIVANRAGRDGGAIQLDSASLSINNSEISENLGAMIGAITYGGGIAVLAESGDADLSVNNSTISGNFVRNGGGISAWVSAGHTFNLSLSHCTIAGNAIESGGAGSGLYTFVDTSGTFQLDVANCIIANGAMGGNFQADGSGTVTINRAFTLLQDSTLPDGGINGNIDNADPLLGALKDYGGFTRTQAPFAASPAVDAGDPAFIVPPNFDQRGSGFPRLLNGRLDIGAHESFLPLYLPIATVR